MSTERRFPGRGWAVLGGLVTLLLGIMIWSEWPVSGVGVIGTFVGSIRRVERGRQARVHPRVDWMQGVDEAPPSASPKTPDEKSSEPNSVPRSTRLSLLDDRLLTLLARGGEALDWSAIGQLAARDAGL